MNKRIKKFRAINKLFFYNYFKLVFLLALLISCDFNKKTTTRNPPSTVTENINTPNIFVVKVTFPSKDGLLISADMYEVNGKKPTILLCHQAGFSRGEYKDTAIKLAHLGYSSLAIDQRSGNEVYKIVNETAKRAKDKKLATNFLDARQDIEAAIDYLYALNGNKPMLLIGSSYSASLVLLIGKANKKIGAIAAFSPGEYLKGIKMSNQLKDFDKPVFVTSSKKEIQQIEELNIKANNNFFMHYKPTVKGIHGSKALWDSTNGNQQYWDVFKLFLKNLKI